MLFQKCSEQQMEIVIFSQQMKNNNPSPKSWDTLPTYDLSVHLPLPTPTTM